MYGELSRTTSRMAIIAAAGLLVGGLTLTPAYAADLGGDCCADLEERVAELEATTVRKGNRRVSLTISGEVSRVIGWLEDADGDSEFFSAGNGVSASNIAFAGEAKLSTNWTAGYELAVEFGDHTGNIAEAGRNAGGGGPLEFTTNVVSLTHSQVGTIAFGLTGAPTDGVSAISLAGRDVTGDSDGINDWNGIIGSTGNLAQGDHQAIAYISPELAGFSFAVAWADLDDAAVGSQGVDAWDMALRYAQEFGPIQFAAGIGYTTVDHDTNAAGQNVEGANLMGSAAIKHKPTGLNVAFATGKEYDGGLLSNPADADNASFWHVEGGIVNNFTGVGDTSIYGEYGSYDSGAAGNDETIMWGLGVVQSFDSAATELFIAYRNWQDKDDIADGDVSQVLAGMRIGF